MCVCVLCMCVLHCLSMDVYFENVEVGFAGHPAVALKYYRGSL